MKCLFLQQCFDSIGLSQHRSSFNLSRYSTVLQRRTFEQLINLYTSTTAALQRHDYLGWDGETLLFLNYSPSSNVLNISGREARAKRTFRFVEGKTLLKRAKNQEGKGEKKKKKKHRAALCF